MHNTKNFKIAEFSCKCGCGFNIIDQRVIDIAQSIRDFLGIPIHVNSGCRCEKHNKASGGVSGSFHTEGLAADLSCKLGSKAIFCSIANLKAQGKLHVLDYCIWYADKDFVHIDCGKKRNLFFEVRP